MISFFINKYEKIHHLDNYGLLIDRFELLRQAFEMENQFQFFKLRLLQRLNYLYSQIVDPLYVYHLSVQMLELINKVPLIDVDGFSFADAYKMQT